MRNNAFLMILLVMLVMQFTAGCAYPIRYDGPYEGRVIDADTGKPIEGVVILGVWYKEEPTVAGAVSSYYDAKETVTDINGEFEISGLGLKIMSNVAPMYVVIFKAGYEYLGLMPWISLQEDMLLSKKIKWEGEKAIIPLRKLPMEERKKRLFGKENIPDEKQKLLIREMNKEKRELGKPTYPDVK